MREELNAEAWKVTVTGESTSIERKNRTALECSLDIPVFLTMNNYPVIKDDSDACYNRALVLPMTRQWSEEEAVPIARLVVATRAVRRPELGAAGLGTAEGARPVRPAALHDRRACRSFKGQNNPLEEFLALCIEPAPDVYVMRDDFLRIANSWLKREIQPLRPWSGKAVGLAIANNNRLKIIGDEIKPGPRLAQHPLHRGGPGLCRNRVQPHQASPRGPQSRLHAVPLRAAPPDAKDTVLSGRTCRSAITWGSMWDVG